MRIRPLYLVALIRKKADRINEAYLETLRRIQYHEMNKVGMKMFKASYYTAEINDSGTGRKQRPLSLRTARANSAHKIIKKD